MGTERVTTQSNVNHTLRFYPNTLASQCGDPDQAARLRGALHFTVANPSIDPSIAEKRSKTLEKLNMFVAYGESNLKLSDFDAHKTNETKIDLLERSTFLPGKSSEFRDLVDKAITVHDRKYFNKRGAEGHALITKVDELTYKRIQTAYGLSSPQQAQSFFEKRVEEANQILATLLPKNLNSSAYATELNNETSFVTSPGRLVFYALSPLADPKLQYEALRTLTVAELLAQNVKHAKGLKGVIGEYQTAIDDEIFNHGHLIGETKPVRVYAIFDSKTGEPLWNSYSDKPLSPQEFADFSTRGMLKEIDFKVRPSQEAGKVYTDPRTKGKRATLEKIIREAQKREESVGDDILEPRGASDLGGIMQVLFDERSLDGETMQRFIDSHIAIAKDTFGPDTKFVERNETNGYDEQSQDHQFRRIDIMVTRDGREYKIEMLFEPLKTYLKNKYEYGPLDSKRQRRTGPAHRIYEALRWKNVAKLLFPSAHFGEKDWDALATLECDRAIQELQLEDAIPFDMLPDMYRESYENVIFPN